MILYRGYGRASKVVLLRQCSSHNLQISTKVQLMLYSFLLSRTKYYFPFPGPVIFTQLHSFFGTGVFNSEGMLCEIGDSPSLTLFLR
jgi:hypothetical protein